MRTRMPTQAKTVSRPALRYHGGKWRLADWVLGYFPAHRIYVEPFCGACSLLLKKERAYCEVVSDMDGLVCNLFRVLRDPSQARELQRLLHLTPYARGEFEAAYLDTGDPIEQARRLIVRSFMGFGSASVNSKHRTGFRACSNRSGTTPSHDWAHYPAHLLEFTERLRGVVIENRSAFQVIPSHDTPETLFYVDPPYLESTRYMGRESCVYRFDMAEEEHRQLADVLRKVEGMVVLSGYASPLYDVDLYPDWQRVERRTFADGAKPRTEVLWLNPACVAALAREREQGALDMELADEREEKTTDGLFTPVP